MLHIVNLRLQRTSVQSYKVIFRLHESRQQVHASQWFLYLWWVVHAKKKMNYRVLDDVRNIKWHLDCECILDSKTKKLSVNCRTCSYVRAFIVISFAVIADFEHQ